MRDILAGGVLTPAHIPNLLGPARKPRPRRRIVRTAASRIRKGKCISTIQPGQLASPFLTFGFPSLALH